MSKTYLKGSLLATTVIAGFAVAMPAFAQDAPLPAPEGTTAPAGETPVSSSQAGTTAEEGPGAQAAEAVPPAEGAGGEIIVTGSLIRNPNLTSSSPVAVVGQEEIQLRQANNVEQILRTIPGVTPSLGQNVNNGANGTALVDLRGLGLQRNLVLLDATRIVPANAIGAVDLNNIPISLLDRVDVLTGGASTTYGADAVTGVVNFITKKNFAGVDIQVSNGISERGDGQNFRADLALGANFDDGRGNAVLAIGYMESDPIFFGDRASAQCVISSITGLCSGDSATSTPTAFQFSADQLANIGLDPADFPFTPNIQLSPDGTELIAQYSLFNFNPFNVYQTPFKRYNLYSQAHYDISDDVTVYARGIFSKNFTSSIIAPSGVFAESLTVPGTNPFLTPAIRNTLCQLNDIALGAACDTNPAIPLGYVYRRTVEVGPRIDEQNTVFFDFKAGATWNITENLSFDLYGAYGESNIQQRRNNYVAKSRLQQALNASTVDACDDSSSGCVPLNLFGPPGSITPEMAGFIGGIVSTIDRGATLAQVHGVLSGDFGATMPWASDPIAFAIGAEHRDYTGYTRPDALAQVPGELGGAGGAIIGLEGGYTAEDAFAELIVPVASDRPFMQELSIQAGYRRSAYEVDAPGDPSFNASSYKIGGTWQPVEAVKFRGNWQQAVRAPNISELFTPVAIGLVALTTDPCAGAAPVANPNLAAVCIAQGAPPGSIGSIPNPTAGQANITTGGNPFLKPETSRSWTAGVVLTPRSLIPGFNATLDYYKIKVKDAITIPSAGDIINLCFANITATSATDPNCTGIRRNQVSGGLSGSSATVPGLPAVLSNQGRLKTDGFDLTANYRRNIGFSDLILNFSGNYTRHASLLPTPASVEPPNCAGVFSVNCGISLGQIQPKYSFNQRTTLAFKHVDVSLLWRFIGKIKYEEGLPVLCDIDNPPFNPADPTNPNNNPNNCTGFIRGVGPQVGDEAQFMSIPAFHYFDLTTRFSITDHFDLTLAALNIFDKDPPIVGANAGTATANSGNTFPSTYDGIGRRYVATARLKF
jgi:outer membrane receptor protein involved in Fe transport